MIAWQHAICIEIETDEQSTEQSLKLYRFASGGQCFMLLISETILLSCACSSGIRRSFILFFRCIVTKNLVCPFEADR